MFRNRLKFVYLKNLIAPKPAKTAVLYFFLSGKTRLRTSFTISSMSNGRQIPRTLSMSWAGWDGWEVLWGVKGWRRFLGFTAIPCLTSLHGQIILAL